MINYYLEGPDGQAVYYIPTDRRWLIEGQVGTVHVNETHYAVVVVDAPTATLKQTRKEYAQLDEWEPTNEGLKLGLGRLNTPPPESAENLYFRQRKVTETIVDIDVSEWRPIPGEQRATVPPNWLPSGHAHFYGPGFTHLVAGHLTGFRSAAVKVCKEYGDCYDSNGGTSPLSVRMRTFWSPPKWTKPTKREPKRQSWNVHQVDVVVPNTIAGFDLLDAEAKWDLAINDIRRQLEGEQETFTCGHCGGHGYVEGKQA